MEVFSLDEACGDVYFSIVLGFSGRVITLVEAGGGVVFSLVVFLSAEFDTVFLL